MARERVSVVRYIPRTSRERLYAPHSAAPLREAVSRHWERGAVKVVLEKERGKEEWTLEAMRFEREAEDA